VESSGQSFGLSVPSSPENLARIRAFVVGVGEKAGLPEEEVGKLELAVDEACANVIEHAYGGSPAGEIAIRAVVSADAVTVSIADTGHGFDAATVLPAAVGDLVARRESGGLGMRLIRSLMDEVRYESEPGKRNTLHLSKRLRRP
jgi:serine/threonine-protein kinase RsbW